LRSLVRFLHLHVLGAVSNLEMDGNLAMLSYEIYQPGTEATDQVGDGAVASMFNIMLTLCCPERTPSELRFARRKPDDVRPLRSFFRAPLIFDAEQNAVMFAAEWLNHRLLVADPELHDLLLKQVSAVSAGHSYRKRCPAARRSSRGGSSPGGTEISSSTLLMPRAL
jgi:hypothetical protein